MVPKHGRPQFQQAEFHGAPGFPGTMPQQAQEERHSVPPPVAPRAAQHDMGGPSTQQPSSYGHGLSLQKEINYVISTTDTDDLYKFKGSVSDFKNWRGQDAVPLGGRRIYTEMETTHREYLQVSDPHLDEPAHGHQD